MCLLRKSTRCLAKVRDENRESNKADYERSDKEGKEKDTGEMKIATTTTLQSLYLVTRHFYTL